MKSTLVSYVTRGKTLSLLSLSGPCFFICKGPHTAGKRDSPIPFLISCSRELKSLNMSLKQADSERERNKMAAAVIIPLFIS